MIKKALCQICAEEKLCLVFDGREMCFALCGGCLVELGHKVLRVELAERRHEEGVGNG